MRGRQNQKRKRRIFKKQEGHAAFFKCEKDLEGWDIEVWQRKQAEEEKGNGEMAKMSLLERNTGDATDTKIKIGDVIVSSRGEVEILHSDIEPVMHHI